VVHWTFYTIKNSEKKYPGFNKNINSTVFNNKKKCFAKWNAKFLRGTQNHWLIFFHHHVLLVASYDLICIWLCKYFSSIIQLKHLVAYDFIFEKKRALQITNIAKFSKTFLALGHMYFFHFPRPLGSLKLSFCLAWSVWNGWIICFGALDVFFPPRFSPSLDFENCQNGADSVFSNPCCGFCNQRKKSIFRMPWVNVFNFSSESLHSSPERAQRRANLDSSFRPSYKWLLRSTQTANTLYLFTVCCPTKVMLYQTVILELRLSLSNFIFCWRTKLKKGSCSVLLV